MTPGQPPGIGGVAGRPIDERKIDQQGRPEQADLHSMRRSLPPAGRCEYSIGARCTDACAWQMRTFRDGCLPALTVVPWRVRPGGQMTGPASAPGAGTGSPPGERCSLGARHAGHPDNIPYPGQARDLAGHRPPPARYDLAGSRRRRLIWTCRTSWRKRRRICPCAARSARRMRRTACSSSPVALVAGGGGGGTGTARNRRGNSAGGPGSSSQRGAAADDATPQDSGGIDAGGGFGGLVLPSGAYVVKGDRVRWIPAVDVTSIVLASLSLPRVLARARTRRRRHHSRP
jgi:hypothetical protein